MREKDDTTQSTSRLRILQQSWTSVFMTLTSIVMGAVFGYFDLIVGENLQNFDLARWVMAGSTFLAIIYVWHNSMMTALVFQNALRMRESIGIFVYGAEEFMKVRALGTDIPIYVWFFVVACALFVGSIMFMVVNRDAKADKQTQDILDHSDNLLRQTYIIACGFALLIMGLLILFIRNEYLTVSLTILNLLLTIGAVWETSHYWGGVVRYLDNTAK